MLQVLWKMKGSNSKMLQRQLRWQFQYKGKRAQKQIHKKQDEAHEPECSHVC